MAQTGFTPILIYSSTTASQAPAAGNLTNSTLGSELAINITDGKLFYKDNANNVQVIAWKTTPTSAGGTGLTSYTAGDLLYYATGTTLTKLGIGSNGTILKSTGTAPAWETVANLAVESISFGTTGLTPSTATKGAVTVAGTLVAANGGTGQSSYTVGDILYASGSTTLSKLADVATGNALISGGVGVAPSWGKIGLATHVSGTLPTANGGTNLTSFTANGIVYASSTSALATGSALTFDGTNFATTGSATATRFIPSGSTIPTNGLYLPATNAVGIATDSAQRARFDATGKFSVGKITTPDYPFDFVMNNATPSGTRVIGRMAGDNWNGNQNNIRYASAVITTVSATTVGANRMLRIDLENANFNFDGVSSDTATTYAVASDTTVNIQTKSTGLTQTAKLRPFANNTYTIGDATMRWSEVFASNGTINTSDANFKTNVADLSDAEKAVAIELKGLVKRFQYKDSIAKKGDQARIHVGVIAQEVAAAFVKHGLDANRYGLYCENTVYVDQDGGRFDKNTDRDGNIVDGRNAVVERGIRYDQLLAFIIAAL